MVLVKIAQLSRTPAPAGLSLALFPNYPATWPDQTRPDPTEIAIFWAISQPVLNVMRHNQSKPHWIEFSLISTSSSHKID